MTTGISDYRESWVSICEFHGPRFFDLHDQLWLERSESGDSNPGLYGAECRPDSYGNTRRRVVVNAKVEIGGGSKANSLLNIICAGGGLVQYHLKRGERGVGLLRRLHQQIQRKAHMADR